MEAVDRKPNAAGVSWPGLEAAVRLTSIGLIVLGGLVLARRMPVGSSWRRSKAGSPSWGPGGPSPSGWSTPRRWCSWLPVRR